MKRVNLFINGFLFVAALLVLGTAVLLEWRLPHGRFGQSMTFLGWDRHSWAAIHLWLGAATVTGVVVHLAAHWRWIWRIAVGQRRWALAAGMIVTFGVLTLFALLPVRPVDTERPGQRASMSEDRRREPPEVDASPRATSATRGRNQGRGPGPGREG